MPFNEHSGKKKMQGKGRTGVQLQKKKKKGRVHQRAFVEALF